MCWCKQHIQTFRIQVESVAVKSIFFGLLCIHYAHLVTLTSRPQDQVLTRLEKRSCLPSSLKKKLKRRIAASSHQNLKLNLSNEQQKKKQKIKLNTHSFQPHINSCSSYTFCDHNGRHNLRGMGGV